MGTAPTACSTELPRTGVLRSSGLCVGRGSVLLPLDLVSFFKSYIFAGFFFLGGEKREDIYDAGIFRFHYQVGNSL